MDMIEAACHLTNCLKDHVVQFGKVEDLIQKQ
jgi:hypothetical protein